MYRWSVGCAGGEWLCGRWGVLQVSVGGRFGCWFLEFLAAAHMMFGLVCNDVKHSKIEEADVVELEFLPHSNRMLQLNREPHLELSSPTIVRHQQIVVGCLEGIGG